MDGQTDNSMMPIANRTACSSTVLVTGPTVTVTQNSPFTSLAVAVTIASTHFAYPQRDDQAELAWVAWLNTMAVYPRTVTHLSINPAQCTITLLMMCPMTLPLSLTAIGTLPWTLFHLASRWVHRATRWRHSALTVASSSTSSQVMSMSFKFRLMVSIQFSLGVENSPKGVRVQGLP